MGRLRSKRLALGLTGVELGTERGQVGHKVRPLGRQRGDARRQGLALAAQGCTVKCRVRLLGRACGRRMGPGSQRRGSHLGGMLLFQCVDGIGVMALGRMDGRLQLLLVVRLQTSDFLGVGAGSSCRSGLDRHGRDFQRRRWRRRWQGRWRRGRWW